MVYMNTCHVIWIDECAGTLHVPYELNFHAGVGQFVILFIGDILVYLKSMEEHDDHLRIVLQRL
jgi:hypothetical protein